MVLGKLIAAALVSIFVFCLDVVRRLITFFENCGFRSIVGYLNTALRLIDMAKSNGVLDQDNSKIWRATIRQLNGLQYKQRLLAASETFLYNEAEKMERDMEEKLAPEPDCVVM